jgi:2-polyprenyl-3-methyl-5-hydroxy-6-metoxy-1,4-benzoquinol methylase
MWLKRLLRKIAVSESSSKVGGAFPGTAAADRSDAHRFAHEYWQNCSDTFLASDPSYYDRQEKELRRTLAESVGRVRNSLDVGCGNGRFSFVLAEVSDSLLAFDLSAKLIAEATATAERRNVKGVRFQVRDLEAGVPAGPFDLVACMGVISTLIDDVAYNALIDDLERSVVTGGYVVTKDTLSTVEDGRLVITDTYVTNYRNVSAYEQAFAQRGLRLVDQARLATLEGMINNLYLWRKE